MTYILDINKLKLGDIILSAGSGKGAKAIMLGTGSDFSHSMIYVHHTMIHAIPEGGVYSKNPQRALFDSESHVKVLRLKDSLPQESMENICAFARRLTGSLYSKREAISTQLLKGSNKNAKSQKQFCSRLVAQAYESEGIHLVHNSNYCSPEDINSSNLLEPVTNAIKEASPEEIEFANSDDPNLENQRVTLEWLVKARDLAESHNFEIQSIADTQKFLIEHGDHDSTICDYITESGYLTNYKADCSINPHRYNIFEFLNALKTTSSSAHAVISAELSKEPGLIKHFTLNLVASEKNLTLTGLNYYRIHAQLYKNILCLSKERLEVLLQASSKLSPSTTSTIQALLNDIANVI